MGEQSQTDIEEGVRDRLLSAVQRRFGTHAMIDGLESATLGGSNRTVLFNLHEAGSQRRLVLRQETYALAQSPFLPPHSQYRLLELAYNAEIPVPEPIFELDDDDGLGRGYIVTFVGGETLPKRLTNDSTYARARKYFAAQCGEILAVLHSLDVADGAFLEDVPDSMDPLGAQTARYDSYEEIHPAIELGLRWLNLNKPSKSHRRLLHGDFRNGNLILDPDGIRAVLDWECAHIGDPMEDIGWLCTRSWRFDHPDRPIGGIGTKEEFAAAYHANGGAKIDFEAVNWWKIFGLVRWAVLNIMQAHGHLTGARRALPFAACGRNTCTIEYDLMMTLGGEYD